MKLPYEPVFEDATLEHQIVIRLERSVLLAVTCNCLVRENKPPIATANVWTVDSALAVYRHYHANLTTPLDPGADVEGAVVT